jgi:hypothetical protein
MTKEEYRRKYLIEVEDLIPVLVEDLDITNRYNPYVLEESIGYVQNSMFELLELFQDKFSFFT